VARAPEGKEVEELARKEIIMALRRKVPAAQAKTAISGKPSFKQAVKTAAPELGEPVSVTEPALGKPVSKPLVEPSGRMTTRAPARGLSRTRASKPLSRGIRGGSRERKPFGGPPRDYKPGDEPKEEPKAVVSEEDKKTFEPIMKELKGSLKAKLLGAKNKVLAEVSVRELLKSLDKKKKVQAIVFDGIVTNRVIEEAKKAGISTVVGVKKGRVTEDKDVKIIVLG
jgi:DNA primase